MSCLLLLSFYSYQPTTLAEKKGTHRRKKRRVDKKKKKRLKESLTFSLRLCLNWYSNNGNMRHQHHERPNRANCLPACLICSILQSSGSFEARENHFWFSTFSSCCCCCRIKIKWAALCRGQVICIEGGSSSSISPLQCNWQVEAELPNGTETTAAAAI